MKIRFNLIVKLKLALARARRGQEFPDPDATEPRSGF
jgi:hypothetical protein